MFNGRSNLEKSQKTNYFYQIQGQLNISKRNYCDFVIWTQVPSMAVQRIVKDVQFFDTLKIKLDKYFVQAVLPEILTRRMEIQNSPQTSSSVTTVCICKAVAKGKRVLIQCSNSACPIRFFHLRCVKLSRRPTQPWSCPSCKSEQDRDDI